VVRRALLPHSSAILAALGSAASSGLLASNAAAQIARRDDDDDAPPPLVIAQAHNKQPILLAGHRSHRSHSSHRSHNSHYSGGGGYGGSTSSAPEPVVRESPPKREPPPPPPKPARVSFVAYPGGRIFLDDKPVGRDVTGMLILKPGRYLVRVENRFVGNHTESVEIGDGQVGPITIHW
jgi:hypothetical protein